jgi:Domain of Unknown Function (DUF1206)
MPSMGNAATSTRGFGLDERTPLLWSVRVGFVARGITYGIIGALALALALGAGGTATNQQGALAALSQAPLGKVALIAVALGLLACALWKFVLAATGTGPEGGGGDSEGERLRNLAGGIAYAAFFGVAVDVLAGGGSNNRSSRAIPPLGCSAGPAVAGWSASRVSY